MTLTPTEVVAAVVQLHTETTLLIDRLALDPDAVADVAGDHTLRLRLAEQAVRLAALVDPARFLEELERSELVAWIHDPSLYRRALSESGPADARRLLHAVAPAARLYAAVRHEAQPDQAHEVSRT